MSGSDARVPDPQGFSQSSGSSDPGPPSAQQPPHDPAPGIPKITEDDVVVAGALGEGTHAITYGAEVRSSLTFRNVAFKKRKGDRWGYSAWQMNNEIEHTPRLDHENIQKLLFVVFIAQSVPRDYIGFISKRADFSLFNFIREYRGDGFAAMWDINRKNNAALQIADGLCYIHSRGIIHGDLNPNNILLMEGMGGHLQFKIVIIDFGSATNGTYREYLVHAGTDPFRGPEQYFHRSYGFEADYFTLGTIYYFIYTTLCPFDNLYVVNAPIGKQWKLATEVMHGKLNGTHYRPLLDISVFENVQEIVDIVAGCWEVEEGNRLPVHEVRRRLDALRAAGRLPM